MNRRNFISNACLMCAGNGVVANLLTSCSSTRYVNGTLEASGISLPIAEFVSHKNEKIKRQVIVVHHEKLEFPIYVYRVTDDNYTALWMKCTHQGSELNAAGDHLYCSSHGSEFDYTGKMINGPAEKNLRSFPVIVQSEKIMIELKKE